MKKKLYETLYTRKVALIKMKYSREARPVHPIPNKKYHKRDRNQAYTYQHKINIRAMMSAFFINTGGLDIGQLMAMFGNR